MKIYHDKLFHEDNCELLYNSSLQVYDILKQTRSKWLESVDNSHMDFANNSISTRVYDTYNIFLCPQIGFAELYKLVINYFKTKESEYQKFSVAGWVNVYEENDFLDWHKHGSSHHSHDGRWHGYVCVNAEPSKTLYRDSEGLVETIENKNSYITLSPGGLYHRTTPWEDTTKPRITIAFDFIKRDQIDLDNITRWIPVT